MENSDQQTQILDLGKFFVTELGLDQSVDTFSRWMAHYIAEKMAMAEQLPPGEDKAKAEKECFDTILKLWEHRWLISPGKRPLEDFEPILKTLERLTPEQKQPFFFRALNEESFESEKEDPRLKEITELTTLTLEIDKVARIWIEFVLNQAALKIRSEKTEVFLKNTINLKDNDDIKTLRLVLDSDSSKVLDSIYHKNHKVEKLKSRIEELAKFSKLNLFLLEHYNTELEELT